MAPRIRIPAHVFGYSLATVPAIAYAMYWKRNHKSDEEFEKMLLESSRNKSLIDGSRDKKQNMVSFFDAMKDGDPEQEARMSQVLYGGKGDIKRHHAVDKSLYGTEEGAEQQRMAVEAAAEEQSSREKAIKKKRRKKGGKKRKKKKTKDEDVVAKDDKSKTDSDSDSIDKVGWNGSTAIAASGAATIGTIALAAILIGKRSQ